MAELQVPDIVVEAGTVITRAPEIVIYEAGNFQGRELRTNLNCLYFAENDPWNDVISSIVVVSGTWDVFENARFQGTVKRLVPGYYPEVSAFGFNDLISSFRVVSFGP